MAQTTGLSGKAWSGIALAGSLALVTFGVGAGRALHQIGVSWAAMFLAVAWGLACTGRAWMHTDEVAREAQKSSWFWGGTFGLLLALIAVMTMPLLPAPWQAMFAAIDAHRGAWPLPALCFVLGVVFASLASVAGMLIGCAIWWRAKR